MPLNTGCKESIETSFFDGIHPGLDAFTRVNADGFPVAKAFEDIGGGVGVYGANGYHLQFADPLDMGKDTSGNDNHWTVSVGTVTQVIDAPGLENFAVLDPNSEKGSDTLSNGNLTYSVVNNNANNLMPSTLQTDTLHNFSALANITQPYTGVGFVLNDGRACYYYAQSGTISVPWEADQAGLPTGTAQFEVLIDHDLGQVRFKRNGSFVGAPVSIPSNEPVRFATRGQSGADPASVEWDFGQSSYVPSESGYRSLSIGNLECPAILNPETYVARRECIGGAGVSDLQFSPLAHDVVIISGRRDLETDWRLNYSIAGVLQDPICTNDPAAGPTVGEDGLTLTANGFNVGAATPYQGTCWHRIFRVGGLGGLSVTRVNHTGGTTTAPHGSGGPIAYGFIIPRAGGDIRVFHHKADAGDYWLLNSNAGFANDPGWFVSSANDLTLGGALPVGEYDVIGWPEVDQFSSFSKIKGNGLVNGPQDICDYVPLLMFGRKQGAGESNWIMDRKFNPVTTMQYLSGTTILYSSTGYAIDFNTNGLKWRTDSSSWNPSGGYVFTSSWAAFPIKFATAQ